MADTPGGGNFLTRTSIGGMPNYGWIALGTIALLLWRAHTSSSTSSTSASSQTQQEIQTLQEQMTQVQQEEFLAQQNASLSAYPGTAAGQPQVVYLVSGTPQATTPAQTAVTTTGGTTSSGSAA